MVDPLGAAERTAQAWRALTNLVLGTPEERAAARVLEELIITVSAELSDPEHQSVELVVQAITEHLTFPVEQPSGSKSLAEGLRSWWKQQLSGLFDPLEADNSVNAMSNLGVEVSLDVLVEALVHQLPNSIGAYGWASAPLYAIASEVRQNLQSESLSSPNDPVVPSVIPRRGFAEQALEVIAYVQLAGVRVPTVIVNNDSDASITDVEVAIWLEAFEPGLSSQRVALIGSTFPMLFVREIGPKSGWGWHLEHAAGWSDQARVRSQLHLFFRDASGQRWLSAHDSLAPVEDGRSDGV